MRISIAFICLLLICSSAYTQDNRNFCKAVERENFKKVERLFKQQLKKRKNGTSYYNGPGSGMQVTHTYNIDTLTAWLKSQSCVEDAAWDKCQAKIAIYPGHSSIGVRFKTPNGIQEKCFYLQEGTMGTINIFKWRLHAFKMKNKLLFKKTYDCEGFIEQQKKNCGEQKNRINNLRALRR